MKMTVLHNTIVSSLRDRENTVNGLHERHNSSGHLYETFNAVLDLVKDGQVERYVGCTSATMLRLATARPPVDETAAYVIRYEDVTETNKWGLYYYGSLIKRFSSERFAINGMGEHIKTKFPEKRYDKFGKPLKTGA